MNSVYLLFISLLSVTYVSTLSCYETWECSSVSENYNFVICENGECKCRSDLGFLGNATVEDACRCIGGVYWGNGNPHCKNCAYPSSIIYDNGNPYCVNPPECELASAKASLAIRVAECQAKQSARERKMVQTISSLYKDTSVPTASLIVFGALPIPPLFTADFVGRAFPFGKEMNADKIIEYFLAFAAFGNPIKVKLDNGTTVSAISYFTGGSFDYMSINGTIMTYRYVFENRLAEGNPLSPNFVISPTIHANVSQTGVVRFDCNGNIKAAVFSASDLMKQTRDYGETFPFDKNATAAKVCNNHQLRCVGDLAQFSSWEECFNYTFNLPIGDGVNIGLYRSLDCSKIHGSLILVNTAHCNHVGRNSTTCQDWSLPSYYNDTYYLGLPKGTDGLIRDDQICAQEKRECDQLVKEYEALY